MDKGKLTFSAFEPSNWEEWEQKLLKDLKGLGLNDKGMSLSESLQFPIAAHSSQDIPSGAIASPRQFPRIAQTPASLDNPAILQLLMGGVDALQLETQIQPKWDELLAEVELSFLDINLASTLSIADNFLAYLQENKRIPAAGGNIGLSAEEEVILFAKYLAAFPDWRFFHCACPAKEDPPVVVAAFLEAAQQRFELLDEAGDLDKASAHFSCSIPIGVNFLATIMMLRSIRLVWALLLDSWQLDAQTPLYIQALPQLAHFGAEDPEKNMIRATSICASAVHGGADNVLATPVQGDQEKADFYQRIARNNMHLFAQEGQLGWVNDPAAGAPYIEMGTNLIAEKGWDLFRNEA